VNHAVIASLSTPRTVRATRGRDATRIGHTANYR